MTTPAQKTPADLATILKVNGTGLGDFTAPQGIIREGAAAAAPTQEIALRRLSYMANAYDHNYTDLQSAFISFLRTSADRQTYPMKKGDEIAQYYPYAGLANADAFADGVLDQREYNDSVAMYEAIATALANQDISFTHPVTGEITNMNCKMSYDVGFFEGYNHPEGFNLDAVTIDQLSNIMHSCLYDDDAHPYASYIAGVSDGVTQNNNAPMDKRRLNATNTR